MSQPLTDQASHELLQLLAEAKEKFSGISETEWSVKTAGKWSKKEILGHLIDSAANNHLRFVRAQLAEAEFITNAYEQDHFVAYQHYQGVAIEELIQLWYSYNRHLAHVIQHIDPSKLDVSCVIGSYAPVPFSFVVTDYVTHLRHHLEQILRAQ